MPPAALGQFEHEIAQAMLEVHAWISRLMQWRRQLVHIRIGAEAFAQLGEQFAARAFMHDRFARIVDVDTCLAGLVA